MEERRLPAHGSDDQERKRRGSALPLLQRPQLLHFVGRHLDLVPGWSGPGRAGPGSYKNGPESSRP